MRLNAIRQPRLLALALAGAMLAAGTAPAPAQSTDAGKGLWTEAGCDGCHGANGQGGTNPDLPQAPSLRASELDRDGLTEVISCGVADQPMPAWLMGAYTMVACYDAPVGPEPDNVTITGLYSAEQIQALVDFIWIEFMGK